MSNPFIKKLEKLDAPKPNPFLPGSQVPKPNPFLKKVENAGGPTGNPFIKKAEAEHKSPERMATLREIKQQKKDDEKKALAAALPQEVRDLKKRVDEAAKAYERSGKEAGALFKKLDRAKAGTPRYSELMAEWKHAEDVVMRRMATLQQLMTTYEFKSNQLNNSN